MALKLEQALKELQQALKLGLAFLLAPGAEPLMRHHIPCLYQFYDMIKRARHGVCVSERKGWAGDARRAYI